MGALDDILKRAVNAVKAQQARDYAGAMAHGARHQMNTADPMNNIGVPRKGAATGVAAQDNPAVTPVTDLSGISNALQQTKQALDDATDTPEKQAAREKKAKRDKVMATIGDGLSAFHEAYSHMRGVEPMTSGVSLSARAQARKERLEAQRKEDYNTALSNYLKVERAMKDAQAAQDLADYRKSNIERQRARDEAAARNQAARTNAYVKLQEAKRQNELEKSDYYTAFLDALNNGMNETAADQWAKQEVVRLAGEREAKEREKEQSVIDKNNRANQPKANVGATTTTTSTRYDKDGKVTGRTVTTRSKSGSKKTSTSRQKTQPSSSKITKIKTGVTWK